MAQLLIRDVNPEAIKRLKMQAKKNHRSLQGELKFIVESAAKAPPEETLALSAAWQKRLGKRKHSDSAKLLREDRDR